jgi:hypothetical protein
VGSTPKLQGAHLACAALRGAILQEAGLQGAELMAAGLQGANLYLTRLQGANLREAQLQGASLQDAWLQGAYLREAQLQGAQLIGAALNGANLREAQLQGADLGKTRLQGGDLRYANLYGAYLEQSGTGLIDLQAARWTPLEKERLAEIRMLLAETITDTFRRKQVLDRIERGGKAGLPPPILKSCLVDPDVTPELTCKEKWLPDQIDAFRSELFPVLEQLACESSAIAGGLIRQIDPSNTTGFWLPGQWLLSSSAGYAMSDTTSGRFGLAGRFARCWTSGSAKGLAPCRRRTRTGSAI